MKLSVRLCVRLSFGAVCEFVSLNLCARLSCCEVCVRLTDSLTHSLTHKLTDSLRDSNHTDDCFISAGEQGQVQQECQPGAEGC